MVPVGLAYGELAGLPMAGLYGSMLPLLAQALFGSSRQLVVGPDTAMAAIVTVAVTPLAVGDPGRLALLAAGLEVMAVLTCTRELNGSYPLIRARNGTHTFFVKDISFANSRGVHQQQRRAWYQFVAMSSAKDGTSATSFNHSGAASYAPFERLLAVGTVGRLIEETLRSFDAKPVPEKFVGDVILTPDCMYHLIPVLGRALGGYEFLSGHLAVQGKPGREHRQHATRRHAAALLGRQPNRQSRFRCSRTSLYGAKELSCWPNPLIT
jgi:hypothetical protein